MSNPVVPTPHSRQWTRVIWENGRANAKGRKRRGKQQNKHARKRQRKGSVQRSLWVALFHLKYLVVQTRGSDEMYGESNENKQIVRKWLLSV
jgi:hypothetical protein